MKTTKRFDTATQKLYKAFNEGTLNAFDCQQCAVGSLMDKKYNWAMHDAQGQSFKGKSYYNPPKVNAFTEDEVFNIEKVFLREWQKENAYHPGAGKDKNIQFKGLMAVIDYLAEIDGIETPDTTVKQFELVLQGAI